LQAGVELEEEVFACGRIKEILHSASTDVADRLEGGREGGREGIYLGQALGGQFHLLKHLGRNDSGRAFLKNLRRERGRKGGREGGKG